MMANANFGLGDALVQEAAKVGRKVRVIRRDRLTDKSDLLASEPYNSDLANMQAQIDAAHAET